MKIVYVWAIPIILFVNLINSQEMHTEEELSRLKELVLETRKLGRTAIIKIASKKATEDPETIVKDQNVIISVWYNDLMVKVIFEEHSLIKYIPYGSKYAGKIKVELSGDKVSGSGVSKMYNSENYTYNILNPTYLYRTTKEKMNAIDKVLRLNNASDKVADIDNSLQRRIIIREQKLYYTIQLGDSYPITYKIEKKSGRVYDYKDPYKDFYPTPVFKSVYPLPAGGEWIEMKE